MSHSKTYLLILILLICTTNVCISGSSYYSQLKTIVSSNSTGMGLVYAGTSNTQPSDNSYAITSTSGTQESKDSGKEMTFYAFAKANDGYSFNGWADDDNSTNYVSTNNLYAAKVKSATTDGALNTRSLYAVFEWIPVSTTITYTAPTNGTYTATYSDITITMSPGSETQQKTAAEAITLTATPAADYKFLRFIKEVNGVKSGCAFKATTSVTFTENATIYAEFIPDTYAVFSVDGELYSDLNEANTAALSSVSKTIIVVQDGILPAGNYTISSGNTLLVPYKSDQTKAIGTTASRVTSRTNPSKYRCLTLENGAVLTINGILEVSCQENVGGTGCPPGVGVPSGPYGQIDMNEGSVINLESGAKLIAWGFITGDGLIEAKNNATVYEMFQILDWKGGTASSSMMKNEYKILPVSQYAIQNIEASLLFHYGSKDLISTGVYVSKMITAADTVPFIASEGMFSLSNSASTLKKKYDPINDKQVYEINGNAKLNDFELALSSLVTINIETQNYRLPIANNMVVTIASGTTTLNTNSVVMFAGSELYIKNGATVNLPSGKELTLYDASEWGNEYAYNNKATHSVPYSPTKKSNHGIKDAILNIEGKLVVGGTIYTTISGAEITSTNQYPGQVQFDTMAPTDNITVYQYTAASKTSQDGKTATPAQLKNADASYLSTAGVSANTTINYRNRHWGWLTKWLDYDGTTQLHQEIGINQKESTDYTYTGTIPSDKEFVWEIATDEDNQEVTYTAKLISSEGPALDIVSWTADSLTINATGFTLSGWPYTINGVSYGRENATTSTKCKADRTVTIPYTGKPDGQFQIQVKNKSGVTYSFHAYTIPHIYTNDATLSDTKSTSTVFVNAGNLTINTATTLAAIYVSPSAQLTVSAPLTVGNLYLRTTAWNAAVLQNNSSITADHAYYTRIVADKTRYFQFAIPLSSNTKEVTLSNGLSCPYGKAWLLKSYSEPLRAEQGITNTETVSNWVLLDSTIGTINGTTGYELYSNSAYYREFCFPVTLPASPATQVPVSCTNGAAGALHAGWNALCSPLLGSYKQTFSDPSEAIKVSKLMTWGLYQQYIPETILPAVPFYYQAPKSGNLDFSGKELTQKAPLREWQVKVATQWLRLVLSDAEGLMLDETNIFIHPDKFTVDYESGYDVTKLSLQGEKALLYSELPCGALAFAALPDSLAKTLIPITVYADEDETYTFHLSDNAYRTRLSNVFLRDTETDALIDLTTGDYQTAINKGTTQGRFYITCVFSDFQDINDRLDNPLYNNSDEEVRKILYNDHIYILRNGSIYDITGRRCEIK